MPGFTEPPAAVAPEYTPRPASFPRSTRAEGAGARAILFEHFRHLQPVYFIGPVNGYVLMSSNAERSPLIDMGRADYFARGAEGDWLLDVSPYAFNFEWSQIRYAWLVRHGFPLREGIVAWHSRDIDQRIAAGFVAGEA